MLLAYVDESYSKSRYFLAALVVPEHEAQPLIDGLDAVVKFAVDSYPGIAVRAELHGHDLFQGTGDWESLSTKVRARIGVYARALKVIGQHDVAIVLRGLDRDAQERRYANVIPPHDVVLEHTLERLDEHATSRNSPMLVMADEVPNEANHQRDLGYYQRHSTTGYRARRLSRIVDTIYFAPSVASRLLQAADLVAFLHHRLQVHGSGSDPRAIRANETLWSHVEPKVVHQWLWVP